MGYPVREHHRNQRALTVAAMKQTVNERLKNALAGAMDEIDKRGKILADKDQTIAEYMIAVSVLLKRLGGVVAVSRDELKAALSARVSALVEGDGVRWSIDDPPPPGAAVTP